MRQCFLTACCEKSGLGVRALRWFRIRALGSGVYGVEGLGGIFCDLDL